MNELSARLVGVLSDPATPSMVETYLDTYTGRFFERIGDGGEGPESRDRVTAEDLVAVQMLSVTIPATTAAKLLLGDLGTKLSAVLRDIPTNVALGTDAAADLIDPTGPGYSAWHLLKKEHDMGRTKVSKLLARKRPQLFPVIDEVVACALGSPDNFWDSMHHALRQDGVVRAVNDLRGRLSNPALGDLRLIDIAVWMNHEADHRRGL
jgi:hypothetical protein